MFDYICFGDPEQCYPVLEDIPIERHFTCLTWRLSKQDNKHKTHSEFRIDLAKNLLITVGVDEETGLTPQPGKGDRLQGRHFPGKLPQ